MELMNQIDGSTTVLTILSLVSILVIYLQYKQVLLSPYSNLKPKTTATNTTTNPSSSKPKLARCRECSKLKPIAELKICSKCKIPMNQDQLDSNDLNFYYCDQKCQKSNWKTHKLICGNFKDLQRTSGNPADPLNPPISPPENLISKAYFEKRRAEIEVLLKEWSEFHKNLLIFAAIHGLDLIRNPLNSKQILLMISLKRTEADDESQKFTEIADDGQEDTSRTDLDKSNQKDDLIHRKFSVVHVGSLDGENFFNSNPGMLGALKEIENVRKRVKEKGGIGVAILLVRCGPIVQVFPVGLPSQADLDMVPRQKDWRAIFDQAIEAGVPWKPRT